MANASKGYLYPPLWGAHSYNDGAGMHRVLTAAQFIKGIMPFGQEPYNNPKITDEEAGHLAGFDRPKMKYRRILSRFKKETDIHFLWLLGR